MLEQIAPWITPALLVGLFAWLRHDVLRLRQDLRHTEDELRREMGGVRQELRQDLRHTEGELRREMAGMRQEMNARMDGFDERLRALEESQAELRGVLMGKLTFIENYILRRNEPGEAPAE